MHHSQKAGGDPDPEPAGKPGPQQGSAAARVARAAGRTGASGAGGRSGPYLSLGADCDCGAAREGLGRAGRPPAPGRAKSEQRRARGADGGLAPRLPQACPAGRSGSRRPQRVAQSGRRPRGAVADTETAGTGPREEPQPQRQPKEAKEGRGHRVGDPLTRKQLRRRRRALRDRRVRGLAKRRPALPRPAAPGAGSSRPRRDRCELLAPRRREGGRVRPPVGGGPGGLEVASRGPRRTGDREGELRRSPARGCTCPDRP
ncbi:cuticle collagen 39-like [Felis catus]|uniref:cuticle collagen 39-like n=1 Tax=Felis catus TaxID=9685 RepID=UPI001D1A01F3|nr:cuticle collagen 39-like [Felis catus]